MGLPYSEEGEFDLKEVSHSNLLSVVHDKLVVEETGVIGSRIVDRLATRHDYLIVPATETHQDMIVNR